MDGQSQGTRFAASDETRDRWRARHAVVLGIGASAGAASIWIAIASTGRARSLAVITAVVVLGTVVWLVAYSVYRRRPGYLSGGALWAGLGSLRVSGIRSAGLDAELRVNDRRLKRWTRGVGAASARMEVRAEGLVWTFGRFARLVGVRGRVQIPWNRIRDVQVGDIPDTVRGIGGGVAVTLSDGKTLDGEFLGSRSGLVEGLARSPFGLRSS
jgi:hypothetical protein